ncbi:MAG: hypothetical protein O2894_03650 [Planctomycetota bacterium]|nr:hypothetical protein [Planctomycetota bacterium]
MREIWHAAGRAAGDAAKRRVALVGVLMSAPMLLVGAVLSQLSSGHGFAGIERPLAYMLAPLRRAYEGDADVALLGYLTLQGVLLAIVWSFYGGALHRLAAVDLTQGRREETDGAYAFAARHWRGVLGAKIALLVGAVLPLALAIALASLGRIDGWFGGALLAVAIVAATVLAVVAVFLLLAWVVGGLLTTPTIACEDSGAFDALARSFGYAGSGLPRLTLWRLAFLGGVLIGTTWRALRALLVLAVAYACVRLGAGEEVFDRIGRILAASGRPPDAERLGLAWTDYLAAGAAAACGFALLLTWAADLISRVACARTGLYLALRAAVDRVPARHLAEPPVAPAFADAEAAGFEEVARVQTS